MTTLELQLDLFGEVEAYETTRRRDALLVLRDHVRHALELVIADPRHRCQERGEIKVNLCHPWAYSSRREGFYFEHESTWDGWYTRPAHLLAWTELDQLIGADPRLASVREWSASLTHVEAWKDRWRPYELDHEPHTWHRSYIEGDHARAGWSERLHAWQTVLAVLSDARDRIPS